MTRKNPFGVGPLLLAFVAAVMISGQVITVTSLGSGAPPTAVVSLSGPTGDDALLRIGRGWRIEEIASALESGRPGSAAQFLRLAREPAASAAGRAHADIIEGSTLEGYLPPGTYRFGPSVGIDELIKQMLEKFRNEYEPELVRGASEFRMSKRELLAFASVVERETIRDADAPVIAGVFWNRLHNELVMASDATIVYAIEGGVPGGAPLDAYWQHQLTAADLEFESPYNTYVQAGLPPGPIGSPSLVALQATLRPATTDAFFFVAKRNDAHHFSTTLEEHERAIEVLAADRLGRNASATRLQGLLERVLEPVRDNVGVVVRSLATGEEARVNAGDLFTIQDLRQLVAVAARIEREAIDSEAGQLETLDWGEAQGFAHRAGMDSTWLTSSVPVSTANDIAALLEHVARVEADPRALLLGANQSAGEARPALAKYLPVGAREAHVRETLEHTSHAAAIIDTSSGPVLLAVLMEDTSPEFVPLLAGFVYQYFDGYVQAERLDWRSRSCAQSPFAGPTGGALSGRTIVIDPGHGGDTQLGGEAGAIFRFADRVEITESAIVLEASLRLKDLLVAEGARVHLTRCSDARLGLLERAAIANEIAPDLFVSVHVNGSEDSSRDGTEVYYFTEAGKILANYFVGSFVLPALWHELNDDLSLPNRGARFADFTVLIFADAPAVLSESLYLTNPAEAEALRLSSETAGGRLDQIARGHLRGILAYFAGAASDPSLDGATASAR